MVIYISWDTFVIVGNLLNIPDEDWERIYRVSFACTFETKLQAFQFKIIHRFIAHNVLLSKFLPDHDTSCPNCQELDTIEHKFFECRETLVFWNNFKVWWDSQDGELVTMVLDLKSVIFGIYNRDCYTINNCILLAKFYIHARWCAKQKPLFSGFIPFLKKKIRIVNLF